MAENKSLTLWERTKSFLGLNAGIEGSWRGPFSGVGELGHGFMLGPLEDGWQRNLDISHNDARHVPVVYACVMAIARSMSQCPINHIRETDTMIERVKNTAAYRTMRRPNAYQTSPLFTLSMVAEALFNGESFAVAKRNDRNEIVELHQLRARTCRPIIAEDGSVFYAIGQDDLAQTDVDMVAPARDIMHLRFHTPRHPLIGETPIKAAALAIGVNVSLAQSQVMFYSNMRRPSGFLSTDQELTREQMERLREAFDAQAANMNRGKMPILANGLKFEQLGMGSQDAQLIEAQRMSIQDVCRVYGVPPAMVAETTDVGASAEVLIQQFLSLGLGAYIEHYERELDRLFNMANTDTLKMDVSALIRTDFRARIESLSRAVLSGVMTPDEARGREGLGPIDGGDNAFMQRQMVPVSLINDLATNEMAAPSAPPPVEPKKEEGDPDVSKALVVSMLEYKRKSAA